MLAISRHVPQFFAQVLAPVAPSRAVSRMGRPRFLTRFWGTVLAVAVFAGRMHKEYGERFWVKDEFGDLSRVYFSQEDGQKRETAAGIYGKVLCEEGNLAPGPWKIHLCSATPCPLYKPPWTYRPTEEQPKHVTLVDEPPPVADPAASSDSSSSSSSSEDESSEAGTAPLPLPPGPSVPLPAEPDARLPLSAPPQSAGPPVGLGDMVVVDDDDAGHAAADSSRAAADSSQAAAPALPAVPEVLGDAADVEAVAEQCFRKPFAFVGLAGPVVLSHVWQVPVRVAFGTSLITPSEEWAPSLRSAAVAAAHPGDDRPPLIFAWVEIRATGENEWEVNVPVLHTSGNHWIPLVRTVSRPSRRPHDTCGGRICGQGVCVSKVTELYAPMGLLPANVRADGDCFMHSALFLRGVRHEGPGGTVNRAGLREELADWLLGKAGDRVWQMAMVELGESGLALDVAAREAERRRERACSVARKALVLARSTSVAPVAHGSRASEKHVGSGNASDDNYEFGDDPDPLAGLLEESTAIDNTLGAFELRTLMEYIGAKEEYEAIRLARSLTPEQLTALVDKCSRNPSAMIAPDRGGRKRKAITEKDVQATLAAASGTSCCTAQSRKVFFGGSCRFMGP